MAAQVDTPKKLEWVQILASASLAAILSFLVALAVWYFTKEEEELIYETFPVTTFEGENSELSIFTAKIENSGSKAAKGIICVFTFPQGSSLVDKNVEPSSSAIEFEEVSREDGKEKQPGNTQRRYKFPLINPTESVKFSFLIDSLNDGEIRVELRGEGVAGNPKSAQLGGQRLETEELLAVTAVLSVFMLLLILILIPATMMLRGARLIQGKPNKESGAAVNTAVGYCDAGLFDEAIGLIKTTLYSDPDLSYAHSNLARAYAGKGNFDLAESELKVGQYLAKSDDDRLINYYTAAQVYARRGDISKAVNSLEKAIEIDKERAVEKAEIDIDFDSLRHDKRFLNLVGASVDEGTTN